MTKYDIFLQIAKELNEKLGISPLLFGSLGLGQRLGMDLSPDDIDILVPKHFLHENWRHLVDIMSGLGFELYDLHEHAFRRDASAAFAEFESLTDFAGVDISKIPAVNDRDINFFLLGLEDYLKVYRASSKDSYRRNKNNGKDFHKIELIEKNLRE